MPSIAFGTWTLGNGQGVVDQVDQALNVGFEHIGMRAMTTSSESMSYNFLNRHGAELQERGRSWTCIQGIRFITLRSIHHD